MSVPIDKLREHVDELIKQHLPAKSSEKSEFGEVFTPPSMIEKLYTHFPKSVWSNPSYTWLDPAGGIGNFPLVLFFWLMDGLKHKIANETKRAKHIIENMIYIGEINKRNVDICKKIFKTLCPSATLNMYVGDFLKLNTDALQWPSKFNCIIGNPPYNIGGTGLEGSKRTHIVFTKHALQLLETNGYLAFICPPSYREANSPMNTLFKEVGGHFVFIKIYGAPETHKLFHIQGRVDGFVFQKDKLGTTIVDDEYGIISHDEPIDLDNHVPNFGFSIFRKLYDKVKQIGHVEAFRNTELSSVKTNLFNCHGRHKVLHLIVEKGRRVLRSMKKHSLANTPKLFINGLGVPYVYYDAKGEYAPSQSPVIIVRPSKNIVNLLKSDFFAFIAWGLRLTGNNNLPYLFTSVPDISKEKNEYNTMKHIQKGFNLTANEMAFIQQHFHAYTYDNKDIYDNLCKGKTKKISSSRKHKKTRSNRK